MLEVLFASHNKGKIDELTKDFNEQGIDLKLYTDVTSEKFEIPEDSEILAVNANEKASVVANHTGYFSLGDDSGVFIEALDYFPGVHSRRWSGSDDDDLGRDKQIINLMKDEENRNVYLISRFSLVDETGDEICKTYIKNKFEISYEIKGNNGFGYDPILIPSKDAINSAIGISDLRKEEIISNQLTIACLTQDEKNAINNRGRIASDIKKALDEKGINY